MTSDKKRMTVSVIAAICFHLAALVVIQVFFRPEPEEPPFAGPIYVTLASELRPFEDESAGGGTGDAVKEKGEVSEADSGRVTDGGQPGADRGKENPAGGGPSSSSGGETSVPSSVEEYDASRFAQSEQPLIEEPAGLSSVDEQRDTDEVLAGGDFSPTWEEEFKEAEVALGSGEESPGAESGGPGSGETSLDMGRLDEALQSRGDGNSSGNGGSNASSKGGNETAGFPGMPGIQWQEAAAGRGLLKEPKDPDIPAWVKREGLYLTVVVDFDVTPQGRTTNPRVVKSSGYADVDAAVLDAVRNFRFNPIEGKETVTGRVPYVIDTKKSGS
jgi:TonB family protein